MVIAALKDTEQSRAFAFRPHVLGIVLALASSIVWGGGDFLSGLMSRRLPLLTVLLITQGAGVPCVLVAGLVSGVPAEWSFVPLACLASLCGLLGLGSLFHPTQGAGVATALLGVALIAWR